MNQKKVIAFVFFSLMLFSVVAGLVSAQAPSDPGVSLLERLVLAVERAVGSDFSFNVQDPSSGGIFPKILFFLLVTLIVYSVSGFLPFIKKDDGSDKNDFVQWGIAIIVGLLSIFFLNSEQIATVLLSYKALGITLTGIIPFIITAVISVQLHQKGHGFFSKILWVAFIVVIGWILLTSTEIGAFGQWTYGILLLLGFIMLLWEKRLLWFKFRSDIRDFASRDRQDQISALTGDLQRRNEVLEAMSTSDPGYATQVRKYNEQASKLRAKGVRWNNWGG